MGPEPPTQDPAQDAGEDEKERPSYATRARWVIATGVAAWVMFYFMLKLSGLL